MIYTSYFSKYKGGNGICIAISKPKWYVGKEFKLLAPKWSFLNQYKNGEINEEEYTSEYYEQVLNKIDANDIYTQLTSIYKEPVLLCYEKIGSFCHRNIVSEWFRNVGLEAEELV